MTKTTTKTSTQTTSKKRIFYPGKFYVATEDNYCIPFDTLAEAIEYADESTDTVLIARQGKLTVNKADKIVIDFTKKQIIVTGATVTINKVEYTVGTHTVDDEELKDFDDLIKDANKNCKELVILGTPPIEGIYLEY